MPCDHIRVEIFHIQDEATGQTKVDPHVKAVYTEKKFRWKTLTNDPATGKRAQIMQYNNTEACKRQEPFTIKLALVFSVDDNPIIKATKADKLQIIAPISEMSLGVNDFKLEEGSFIATKTL